MKMTRDTCFCPRYSTRTRERTLRGGRVDFSTTTLASWNKLHGVLTRNIARPGFQFWGQCDFNPPYCSHPSPTCQHQIGPGAVLPRRSKLCASIEVTWILPSNVASRRPATFTKKTLFNSASGFGLFGVQGVVFYFQVEGSLVIFSKVNDHILSASTLLPRTFYGDR